MRGQAEVRGWAKVRGWRIEREKCCLSRFGSPVILKYISKSLLMYQFFLMHVQYTTSAFICIGACQRNRRMQHEQRAAEHVQHTQGNKTAICSNGFLSFIT